MKKFWEIYEDAAREVISHLTHIYSIEGKQKISGISGTSWELDARALIEEGQKFLVVEVRRYTNSALKQEDIAAIAFRILDVGGSGGIVVSPIPMQKGATLVARSIGIEHIRLTPESTPICYLAEYMGKKYLGVTNTETCYVQISIEAEVIQASK